MTDLDLGPAIDAAGLAMYGVPHLAERYREVAEAAITAAAPLIEAETRRKIAEEIEATFAAWARNELPRPKVERGEFVNDREWAVAIARGSGGDETARQP